MANNKFVIPVLQPSYSDKIKRNGKGRALHMYGEGGDTQRAFECVNLKETVHLEELGVEGTTVLKLMSTT